MDRALSETEGLLTRLCSEPFLVTSPVRRSMLIALEIENLKGIAARQRIDFAPLTLRFGANSAGKSTILQALLYLHELIERGSADVDRTELGDNVLELGGFARLVHRHEIERAIVLRGEFATPGGLERFGRDPRRLPVFRPRR